MGDTASAHTAAAPQPSPMSVVWSWSPPNAPTWRSSQRSALMMSPNPFIPPLPCVVRLPPDGVSVTKNPSGPSL
jgi:hypothetical protein